MSKILILGDGLLGSELVKQTGWDYTSRKMGFNLKDINFNPNPKIIINCIACTDTYGSNRDKHWEVNYKFVSDLVDYCNLNSIKLVHISTDYLYTHSVKNASENSVPVHCATWYGYTKLLSDGYIQLKSNNYLLIRTSHKLKPFPYKFAWKNLKGNFDYVDKISKLIITLIKNNKNGLYNVGTNSKTIFELALQTNSDVKPVINNNSLTPTNITMDVNKLLSELKKV
jgi:dTDP-4-dehydrorhamnose reductase